MITIFILPLIIKNAQFTGYYVVFILLYTPLQCIIKGFPFNNLTKYANGPRRRNSTGEVTNHELVSDCIYYAEDPYLPISRFVF